MRANDVIALARPNQWAKNLAVFAALIFAGDLAQPILIVRVILAFIALDLVTGGLYALNDAVDAEFDRVHPVKRARPVASGRISKRQSIMLAAGLIAVGLTASFGLGLPFFACVVGYLFLQITYISALKHLAIVEMLIISTGFVIRAVAGAVVISVRVSPWLVLCTGLLALFLVAGKRRHELLLLREHSASHRPVLAEYSEELLDGFMVTLSGATITSYALYTFFEARAPGYSMMLTIPFVIYGIQRYQLLVLRRDAGGRPEAVLFGDLPMAVCIALWGLLDLVVLYLLD